MFYLHIQSKIAFAGGHEHRRDTPLKVGGGVMTCGVEYNQHCKNGSITLPFRLDTRPGTVGVHDRGGWPRKTTRDGEWFERSLRGICRSITHLQKRWPRGDSDRFRQPAGRVPIGSDNPRTSPDWFCRQVPIGPGAEQ